MVFAGPCFTESPTWDFQPQRRVRNSRMRRWRHGQRGRDERRLQGMKHARALARVRLTVALVALAFPAAAFAVSSPIMSRIRRRSYARGTILSGGAVLLTGAALLSACASSPSPPSGGSTAVASPVGSWTGHRSLPGATILLLDRDNRRTLSVSAGTRVSVRLANTYWQFARGSDRALRQDGAVVVRALPPASRRCVPGEGCGTVVVSFEAVRPGRQTIIASRTTCGEAMGCTEGQGHYQVTVVVR